MDDTEISQVSEPAVRYGKALQGLSKSEFLAIVAMSGFNLSEFSSFLPVSKRTIEKVKEDELLSPQVSDRVLQIEAMYQYGADVFESIPAFKEWLQSPLLALGNKRPVAFLKNETGLSIINDLLGRIAYGVYS